jgi:hypothetical protein
VTSDLSVVVQRGEYLADYLIRSRDAARELGVTVRCEYDGVTVMLHGDMTVDDLVHAWQQARLHARISHIGTEQNE